MCVRSYFKPPTYALTQPHCVPATGIDDTVIVDFCHGNGYHSAHQLYSVYGISRRVGWRWWGQEASPDPAKASGAGLGCRVQGPLELAHLLPATVRESRTQRQLPTFLVLLKLTDRHTLLIFMMCDRGLHDLCGSVRSRRGKTMHSKHRPVQ